MANAYTPGLKVTAETHIIKRRRLPILGEILVEKNAVVTPDTLVARAFLSGNPQSIPVAPIIGCDSGDLPDHMLKAEGDFIEKGEVIARRTAFFGLIKSECSSPVAGKLEHISNVTGQVIVREPPVPILMDAYISGIVTKITDKEEVTIETNGAFIQGIFGVGGEQKGTIRMMSTSPSLILDESHIDSSCKDQILIGGALVTGSAIKKAVEVGAKGIVSGGIVDNELVKFLGFDIGVAITGHENIPISIILTEGFGNIPIADKTFELLTSLNGCIASINGATQIRAGVLRPEIIVPFDKVVDKDISSERKGYIEIGDKVRCIREPYFGMHAVVVDLPPMLQAIETESIVRIMRVKLDTGEIITVPRANIEII